MVEEALAEATCLPPALPKSPTRVSPFLSPPCLPPAICLRSLLQTLLAARCLPLPEHHYFLTPTLMVFLSSMPASCRSSGAASGILQNTCKRSSRIQSPHVKREM